MELRGMGKCGGNPINQKTMQRTDRGLHVIHTLREKMPATLPKYTNPGENTSYPTGSRQAACEIINYTWECNQF